MDSFVESFKRERVKTMVRSSDPKTSFYAAEHSVGRLSETCQRILQFILEHPEGVTDEQIWMGLNINRLSSVSKRRGDLVKDGYVFDSGTTREISTGRQAIVWLGREESSEQYTMFSDVPSPRLFDGD